MKKKPNKTDLAPAPARNGNGKRLATQQSVNAAVKSICDVMRRSNCAGALQYVPELTWILFLRILDEREAREAEEAEAVGTTFRPSLKAPYRWRDWAAPEGKKRTELATGSLGAFFGFVNAELLPYLKGLRDKPNANPRQKVISEIMSGVDRTRIDTERNLLDVLDKVHEITGESIDQTHVFPLSQVYEGLLLKMGEKGNDGGQFFTPREVIRALVRAVDPKVGQTVYDPCCGTGGFLVQTFQYMQTALGGKATADQIETLKRRTLYGREKENLVAPIALANMVLHGIDEPRLWHGNTLTGNEIYGGLFQDAPALYDVVLTNPPFGGKEGAEAQTRFPYKTGATQVLFLQHIIDSLKSGGRCGMVIDEGVMFRTNETAFVQTKRKLLDDCDLWCVVSLPPGVFLAAGGGVKTNLLFFTKGEQTEKVWYYDLSGEKVTKKRPLTLDKFGEFFLLLPKRKDSDRSWTVTRQEIEARNYDLKAINPNAKSTEDTRTPEVLIDAIEAKGREVTEAVRLLKPQKARPSFTVDQLSEFYRMITWFAVNCAVGCKQYEDRTKGRELIALSICARAIYDFFVGKTSWKDTLVYADFHVDGMAAPSHYKDILKKENLDDVSAFADWRIAHPIIKYLLIARNLESERILDMRMREYLPKVERLLDIFMSFVDEMKTFRGDVHETPNGSRWIQPLREAMNDLDRVRHIASTT